MTPQIQSLAAMLMTPVRPIPSTDEFSKSGMKKRELQTKVCEDCGTPKKLTEFAYVNPEAKSKMRRRKKVCIACETSPEGQSHEHNK